MKQSRETIIAASLLIKKAEKILMIFKKRGVLDGLYNIPGGKKEDIDENLMQTAIRETEEEVGLKVDIDDVLQIGDILVENAYKGKNFYVEFFYTEKFEGELSEENDECYPLWVDEDKIPYDKMHETDKDWFLALMNKERFSLVYPEKQK